MRKGRGKAKTPKKLLTILLNMCTLADFAMEGRGSHDDGFMIILCDRGTYNDITGWENRGCIRGGCQIFINVEEAQSRSRHTLAHEFGHFFNGHDEKEAEEEGRQILEVVPYINKHGVKEYGRF